MTHHYLVTETVPEFLDLDDELPVVRDDAKVSGYVRMEQKSGLIGIYEKANPNTVWLDGAPWEAESELFAPDYDRIMPWLENAMERMPVLAELGIRRAVHGAITPPAGRQHAARPRPRARQLLVLLRLPDRHRLGPGRGPIPRAVDGARGGGGLDARIRPAPLRRLRGPRLRGHQGAGGLPAAPRDPVSALQTASRADP